MSSVSLPIAPGEHPQLRALNIFRDLPQVADLIELCFADTLDGDGQRYISDMRRASREFGFHRWARRVNDTTTLPLTGFVWEENNRIVGNASLIPFNDRGRRIYFIANIAVHPDHRRRGIARIVTHRAMQYGWSKKAWALWLQVHDNNAGAINLYNELGFKQIAHRTTWKARTGAQPDTHPSDIQIVPRHVRHWPQQQDWLRRLHPDVINWYRPININALRPGLFYWLYRLFVDMNVRQWAAVRNDRLLATLSWFPQGSRAEPLLAATPRIDDADSDEASALSQLLLHARHALNYASVLTLEHPADEMTGAFLAAGFTKYRSLLWMRALPAT